MNTLETRIEEATIQAGHVIRHLMPSLAKAIAESEKGKASMTINLTWRGNFERSPTLTAKGSVASSTKTENEPVRCEDPKQASLPME